ncbi:beta-galactosidase [Parabacteroides sp. OttesenSCG-928-G06]|nr:beta-galactosidase [Parabacteroides sp. OttesenSCG-928-K15]MDL2281930.1 beta-galactosidase [Parabacteroides sp. OttesenSCG-928-G06]
MASVRTYQLPDQVGNMHTPNILLNGTWQFKYSPKSKWTSIQVPGEAAMQGYAIEHDKPFFYKKSFTLPKEYAGQKVILRFDGVYSHAKLSVNGQFVREHHGGFTRWEADVTSFVKPGKKNEIELEVTDRLDEISYASGYAHHPIGGILRDVTIYALPQTHLYDFYVETQLDSLYRDALLKFSYEAEVAGEASIAYTLIAPNGQQVALKQANASIKKGNNRQELAVSNPLKWDAEHPNLYTLRVAIKQDGKDLYSFERRIGFREVKVKGNQLLVNGKPVKLRGACRHDIHPTLGRTTTAELDSLDALRFKQSNMNFVRTSHYPPSHAFVEYCDKFGIYVEAETAVCFVNTYRQKNYAPGKSQDDPAFKERYLAQYQEMVKTFYSSPSVLFWSIGNESVYGENFQACWDWSKKTDKTRPVIFSYPGSDKKEEKVYEILSMHYQDVHGNVSQWGMSTRGFQGHGIPALFDEWAHPACYTYATLQEDPNIREFWGQSLDMMWSGLFAAQGGLGGATWGYIDEIFMLPKPKVGNAWWKEFAKTAKPEDVQGECVGYGEWGIVDIWRRPKPEFWASKKAYSPLKVMTTKVEDFKSGERLFIPVHNRFDHSNLNEVKMSYTYKGIKKSATMPAIAPHQKGMFIIPGEDWKEGEKLFVEFFNQEGELIDAENIQLGKENIRFPQAIYKGAITVEEQAEFILVKGNNFAFPFSKADGLIHNAVFNGKVIIEKGPFLNLEINLNHLTGAEVRKSANKFITADKDWQKKSLAWSKKGNEVEVKIEGNYGGVSVDMRITLSPEGKMRLNYHTSGQPNGYLREAGVKFYLPESINHLQWKRDGYWSYYPEGEFGGNEGEASFYQSKQAAYGAAPVQSWGDDTRNYYYWADAGANCIQPLTQTAKGMKENIWYYTLSGANDTKFSVVSADASLACRTNKRPDEQLILYINNRWDYPEIAWGNYCKTLEAVPNYGTVEIVF